MEMRTISLVKGEHSYVFRYAPGDEEDLLDEIMRLADDASVGFDWLDAATLSFQITHRTAADCLHALSPFDDLET